MLNCRSLRNEGVGCGPTGCRREDEFQVEAENAQDFSIMKRKKRRSVQEGWGWGRGVKRLEACKVL